MRGALSPLEAMQTLTALFPMALTSGVNLYATVLAAGLFIRYGVIGSAPPGIEVLATWPVIVVAALFFVFEGVADKIPGVDHIWDVLHTLIRPAGAATLAMTALRGTALSEDWVVVAAICAGGVAATSHTAKASARVLTNSMVPGAGIVKSVAEDGAVAALVYFAMLRPTLALALSIALFLVVIVVLAWVLPRAWRALRHEPTSQVIEIRQ